jgi:superfamily II DNA or RNA helicase
VDYRNIPWRNSRFDEEELTRHVATQSRARNAYEQLQKRGGTRTLAFCVSREARGETSAPRAQSLDELSEGNESLDLPELDTVLMLRPTESRILWLHLQPSGRRPGGPQPAQRGSRRAHRRGGPGSARASSEARRRQTAARRPHEEERDEDDRGEAPHVG